MRRIDWFLGLFILALLIGCAEKPKQPATVNGEIITKETLDRHVKDRLRMHEQDATSVDASAMREAVLNQLIDQRLMLQAAGKKGITPDESQVEEEFARARSAYPDEAAFTAALAERGLTAELFRQRIRDNSVLNKFVDDLVGAADISEESLKDHFKSLKAPPTMPERVEMRFIQVSDKEKAEEIAKRISNSGKKGFDRVADDLTGKEGVIVSAPNWVQPSTFSMKMAEVVKGLKKGEWAGPIETKVAMYLVKVYDREEPRPKTFEEAKDELMMIMKGKLREDAVNSWLSTERAKATIVKNNGST